MIYILSNDDYHGHTIKETIVANTDSEAKEKAKNISHKIGYYSECLCRKNEDGTFTKIL